MRSQHHCAFERESGMPRQEQSLKWKVTARAALLASSRDTHERVAGDGGRIAAAPMVLTSMNLREP